MEESRDLQGAMAQLKVALAVPWKCLRSCICDLTVAVWVLSGYLCNADLYCDFCMLIRITSPDIWIYLTGKPGLPYNNLDITLAEATQVQSWIPSILILLLFAHCLLSTFFLNFKF